MSARDTLLRLLTLLPLASRDEGVELEEAARATGVDVDRVMADLEVLTTRSWYLPAGSADDLQIRVDGTRIRVTGPNPFTRPLRLTRGEMLALSIALRVAGTASGEAERVCAEIERELAARGAPGPDVVADAPPAMAPPAMDLGAPPAEVRTAIDEAGDVPFDARDPDGVRDIFSAAVLERRAVAFAYLKPTADEREVRTLEPYRLLHAEGEWYVVGRDPVADGLRLFRLDRVLGAALRDTRFAPEPDFDVDDLVRDGQVALVTEDTEARDVEVRYSPRVAPWVAERWDGRETDDGAYVVRHPVWDERWLLRTVMRYGGEASVAEG